MSDKKREIWIDNAKAIAILAVIVGHTTAKLTGFVQFGFVYGFHLVTFFLLSGYTFRKKPLNREYITGKFTRLMVPYFYTCLAVLATDVFNQYFFYGNRGIASITQTVSRDLTRSFFASGAITKFGSVELGTRIGAIWFLPAMFFAVLLFQGLLQCTEDSRWLGLTTAGLAGIGMISARFIWLPFSLQSGMMASFFLWLGYEIRRRQILQKIRWYYYGIAFVILAAGISAGYCNIGFVKAWCKDVFLSGITGLAGCLLVYLIATRKIPGLARLGQISLTILCTHLYGLETMSSYFKALLDFMGMSGNPKVWMLMGMHILFAVLLALLLEQLKKMARPLLQRALEARPAGPEGQPRDTAIDLCRGMLIFCLLISTFPVDDGLRHIIGSFCIPAFVFFSGCLFQRRKSLLRQLLPAAKVFLLPYGAFAGCALLIQLRHWSLTSLLETLRQCLLGFSCTRNLLPDTGSVGDVWLLPMLFAVRLLYAFVDRLVRNEKIKWAAVVVLSLLGLKLGQWGFWLPWSLDVALYALVFYQLGAAVYGYGLLQKLKNCPAVYFLLSPVWVYGIYSVNMVITDRRYGEYGIAIAGALAGMLLLYLLSAYIDSALPGIRALFREMGQASLIILVVHTLFDGRIAGVVGSRLDPGDFSFLVVSCLLQILLGLAVHLLLRQLGRVISRRKTAAAAR